MSSPPPSATKQNTNLPRPDAILEISESATTTQIRDAYKRQALKTHPDRVPTDSPERATRTRKFQLVNDAYFTLSDPSRRREYDAQRKLFAGSSSTRPGASHMPGGFAPNADPFAEETEGDANAGGNTAENGFSWAWNFFTGQNGAGAANANGAPPDREQTENAQFEDVFEEMLREEGMAEPSGRPTGKFWGLMGGLSGGALGFIVGNVPGLVAGAVAGNRLGAIRDAKGKSVYAVFQVSASGVVMMRDDE